LDASPITSAETARAWILPVARSSEKAAHASLNWPSLMTLSAERSLWRLERNSTTVRVEMNTSAHRAPLGLPSGRVTVGRGLWIVLASSLLLWLG
jgi:hypothetical protein